MRIFQRIYLRVNQGTLFIMDQEVTRLIKLLRLVHWLINKKMAHALRQMLLSLKPRHVPKVTQRRCLFQKQQYRLDYDGHFDEYRLTLREQR